MKNIFRVLFTLLLLSTILISCNMEPKPPTADDVQAKKTEQSLSEANRGIGMPAINNFQEKKLFKQVLEERDKENLITYTYLVSEMTGKIGQFLGKSLGYGIPASTQFTNPTKYKDVYHANGGSYGLFLPQADPNGLFMPTSSSATWIMLLDPEGKARPVYIEPLIIVSPFKLH